MALVCQVPPGVEVFLFLAVDCPISNRFVPELRRLAAWFQPRGVLFRAYFPAPDLSHERLARWVRDFAPGFVAQLDPGQLEAQRLHATHTPQAVVVAQTRVVYRGRIDDRYVSWGRSRPQPTQRDLQRALENILAGRTVPEPWPTPVGCLIER